VAFTATPSMLMALHMFAPAPSILELSGVFNEKQKLHLHLQTLFNLNYYNSVYSFYQQK
jgi:hypothetical protein